MAPFLPPFDNGGVYRPVSWLKYSIKNNWQATVLTRPFEGEPSAAGKYLMKHLPGDVKILRVNYSSLRPAWNLFPRTDGNFINAISSVSKCYQAWKDSPPAVVVATGPSFDLFITAFYLSKIFRAKLVLDYRDEWTLSPFTNVIIDNADSYWEKRCLKNADKVIFTTKDMMQYHQHHFKGLIDSKSCVLHNGWDPDDLALNMNDEIRNGHDQKHVIMYAGTLGDATLPGHFLKDFGKILEDQDALRKKFKIHIIGTQVPAALSQLRSFPFHENLLVEGNFPKDISNKMIRKSNILLLFVPPNYRRISAKLFEYIASGKPIIIHGVKSECSNIVTELDAGYFVEENDPGALAQALQEIASSPLTRWNNSKREKWVMEHTRENLAKKFYDILENL